MQPMRVYGKALFRNDIKASSHGQDRAKVTDYHRIIAGPVMRPSIFHVIREANLKGYAQLGVQWAWASETTENSDFLNFYIHTDVIRSRVDCPYGNEMTSMKGFYRIFTWNFVVDDFLNDQVGVKYAPSVTPYGSDHNRRSLDEVLEKPCHGVFYEVELNAMLDRKSYSSLGLWGL